MATIDRLFAEAMDLSDAERAELASRIAETVTNADVATAWREEFVRRAREHDADGATSLEWEDALDAIFAPLPFPVG